MTIVLHRFPLSHFSEKARVMLDFKGLDYRVVDHSPGPDQLAIMKLSGQRKVPVIEHEGSVVHDSTAISYLLAPDAFTWVEQPVRVDTGQSFGRGRTVASHGHSGWEEPWAERTPVRILTGADSRWLVELELSRLAR